MAYEIDARKCTACGGCSDECPQDAITAAPDGSVYRIDPDRCIDCGACEAACASGAPRAAA